MGDTVYEDDWGDPIFPSYFEHEIISINIDDRIVTTKDHSQHGKVVELCGFHTVEELEKRGIKFEKV